MKKTNKKGFTIVELVIVIAVIAILAAVLVPNISRLVKKANQSADESLVRNLNTALAMDTEKHTTMTAALNAAYENGGYDVAKIVTKNSDAKILWDSVNDCFVYLNGSDKVYLPNTQTNKEVNAWDYFEIVNTKPSNYADATYSIYANWTAAAGETVADLTVGFDAGKNQFASILFSASDNRSVILNTNGGALTIDAEKATVTHYGVADAVKVTAVADKSYHEHGEVVGNLEIVKGRVEFAKTAIVNTVLVSSVNTGDVKIEVVSGANVGTVAPTTANAATDVSNSTTIPADSKVTKVVTPNTDFAGGLGTENSPFLIATAEQFASINSLDFSNSSYYFKQIADISISAPVKQFAGTYDGSNYKLSYLLTSGNYGCIFDELTGYGEFKNMKIEMGKVGVTLLRIADWATTYGASFDNIVFSSTESLTTVNANNFGFVVLNALYTKGSDSVPTYNFTNIINNVNLQNIGTCTGVIIGSGPCFETKTTMNVTNCVNNGDIFGAERVGFLYGNSAYIKSVAESESTINVSNCKNTKTLTSLLENNKVNSAFALELSEINQKYQAEVGGAFITSSYFKSGNIVLNQDGTNFTINTTDNTVVYKLVFSVQSIYDMKDKEAWEESDITAILNKKWDTVADVSNGVKQTPIELSINTDATGTLTTSFKALDKKSATKSGITVNDSDFNADGYAIVVNNGVTYLVFNTLESCYINCDVSVRVYAYAAGTLKGITVIK